MWFIALFFVQQLFASPPTITIAVGDSKAIPFSGKGPLFLEPAEIVSVEDLGEEIRVIGLQPGIAYVRSEGAEVSVEVIAPPQGAKKAVTGVPQNVTDQISKMLGPQISRGVSGRLQIRGHIYRFDDWAKIKSLLKGNKYEMSAKLDPDVIDAAQREMASDLELKNLKLPIIDWQSPLTSRIHYGPKANQQNIRDLTNYLESWGIQVIKDSGILGKTPLVRILIQFVEIEKLASRSLGVIWPSSYQFNLLPKGKDPNPLSIALESLSAKGLAKILASPSLVAKSGGEAEFLAGGEIPIPVRGRLSREVIWKRYGVSLKISPIADYQGSISLNVKTEISSVDPSTSVDGIPGIKSSKMNSSFHLLSKQTLAVSGLIKVHSGNTKTGLAGLSDLPVLGSLFSSTHFLEQKTEMVIFVTPELVDHAAEP